MHPVTAEVTERIIARSRDSRADYLARIEAARHAGTGRGKLSCAHSAHAFAAEGDRATLLMPDPPAPHRAHTPASAHILSPPPPRALLRSASPRDQVGGGFRPPAASAM